MDQLVHIDFNEWRFRRGGRARRLARLGAIIARPLSSASRFDLAAVEAASRTSPGEQNQELRLTY
jgi:hypothetical protein